jgi:cephalosporin-C deacetylase-like acetyl esterase
VPTLFGIALDDKLVPPKNHGEALYEKYAGEKKVVRFNGGHSGDRPDFFTAVAAIFVKNTLQPSSSVPSVGSSKKKTNELSSSN